MLCTFMCIYVHCVLCVNLLLAAGLAKMGMTVDAEGFEQEMLGQKARSKEAAAARRCASMSFQCMCRSPLSYSTFIVPGRVQRDTT